MITTARRRHAIKLQPQRAQKKLGAVRFEPSAPTNVISAVVDTSMSLPPCNAIRHSSTRLYIAPVILRPAHRERFTNHPFDALDNG
jgi:hypothetical protein